jgi:hypothetical protein
MANSISAVDADGHLEESHIDWRDRLPDDSRAGRPKEDRAAAVNYEPSSKAKRGPGPPAWASASAAPTAGPIHVVQE